MRVIRGIRHLTTFGGGKIAVQTPITQSHATPLAVTVFNRVYSKKKIVARKKRRISSLTALLSRFSTSDLASSEKSSITR